MRVNIGRIFFCQVAPYLAYKTDHFLRKQDFGANETTPNRKQGHR
jgi:hypothetical protein